MRIPYLPIISAVFLLQACQNNSGSIAGKRTSFLDVTGVDSTINPADNFFAYANGKWINTTKIPDDQSGWGSFYNVEEDNVAKTKIVLEAAAKSNGSVGSLEQKIGDFYTSGMDTITIEKRGLEPLKAELAKIDALKDLPSYLEYATTNDFNKGGSFLSFYVGADDKNSNKNIVSFGEAGIGLPEKDYYTKKDESTLKIKNAYITYIKKLFTLSGVDSISAAQQAANIIALETKIAASHKSPAELRDPDANYKKFAVKDLANICNWDWAHLLSNLQVKTDTVLMGQPNYYKVLGGLLANTPIEAIKSKEKFELLNANANLLTKAFRDARFEFTGKALSGQTTQKERWKTISSQADDNLGELLGQLWVKNNFTPEAKKRMLELVANLKKVYRGRIEKLTWMDAGTKAKALIKMDKIIDKIGYPDKWKNYDDVIIVKDKYFENIMAARKHSYMEMVNKLSKPVDKTEWGMTPPTVNAYANATYNEIVFPAGILQFPFFDNNADDAINYGGIGMVIGHEMTHLFDDGGRKYDADGNLVEWWTPADVKAFTQKVKVVVDQYNSFTMFGNMHVNGELTLGENLADIGGIAIAYEAFKLTEQGKGSTKIDGLTPDQRFFMSFAQIWRIKNRDETMKVRLTTDPHSPEEFRINGPLRNFEPFYKAYYVTEKNKMYLAPEKRANVW